VILANRETTEYHEIADNGNRSVFRILSSRRSIAIAGFSLILGLLAGRDGGAQQKSGPDLLLPPLAGWAQDGNFQEYIPESLFEYIDGAAESYLSYDFRHLTVGQFKRSGASAALTVEVYDMDSPRNAFGIYSAERYPESRFLPIGVQGYIEEGTLCFLAGRFYIKLMCYDCGQGAEEALLGMAGLIADRVSDRGGFPSVLSAFPRQNLVANSEKFILKNFLGMSFLQAGYTAQYRLASDEFECFIVEGETADEAAGMLRQLLSRAGIATGSDKTPQSVFTWKDRYLKNVLAARSDGYVFGLIRVPDGKEKQANSYMTEMAGALGALGK
jgi:hypothetical protein